MKGQISVINIIVLFIVLLLYMVFLPTIQDTIDTTVTDLESNPNDATDLSVILLQLVPAFFLLSIILTAVYYAIPKQNVMR